jgi:GT2 family glycosyltransferase
VRSSVVACEGGREEASLSFVEERRHGLDEVNLVHQREESGGSDAANAGATVESDEMGVKRALGRH